MKPSWRHRRSSSAERRHRFGVLLVAIIAVFVLQGVGVPGRWLQVIISILLAATFLLALRVADVNPSVMRPVTIFALLVVLFSTIEAVRGAAGGVAVRVADLVLVTLAPPAIVLGVVRSMRARNQVTLEAVFGVLGFYLLLGMFFAFLYGTIARINGSFFAGGIHATAARCLYFSFATLTTVGYGDLTAASNFGHTLAVSEALLGQIYLVTIVSVIVGNLGTSRRAAAEVRGPEGGRA